MTHACSSSIVCLARRENPRARLVCLPHGGGGPQSFAAWPAGLPDWLEVLAFHPPGRGARLREPLVDHMADLIDELVPALVAHLDLPYVLFGHSVGALVAFAAALRLQSIGLPPIHVIVSGHAEPAIAACEAPMANATDADLLGSIAALGLLPAGALETPGLAELVLPPVRADFRLAERYRPDDGARIAAPLTVFGGADDPIVAAGELAAWSRRTEGPCKIVTFAGGHFFTETERNRVVDAIDGIVSGALAALPPSLLIGDREDYPLDTCLHELFRRQARKTATAEALVGIDRTLDFATLDAESDLLAETLSARGCGVDHMVAILMETSVDFVVAYLAILKAGGAYLPIPVVTPDRVIAEILEAVKPVAIVTRPVMRNRLPMHWSTPGRCIALEAGWQDIYKEQSQPASSTPRDQPGPDSLAYCVMTSGTTGKPKGIVCPHRGAVNSYWWRFAHLPYGDDEREACNVFFVWEVLRPLLQGRPAYVIPDDVVFDPRRLVTFLAEHRITRVLFTPSLFEQVLNTCGDGLAERLSALRMVILNGEVVSLALSKRARALLPHVALVNDYSISETHDVTTSRLGGANPAPGSRTLPAGHVMGNVRVYILDDDLKPVPKGVPGEVYVAGPTLARGYLDLPEETAARFLPDPFQGGEHRMFRTGDSGRALPDGQLEIRGRARFMVKLRGYTVVPSAVEAAIASHPAVGAAIVVTVDDPATGQPESLAAYVTGRSGGLASSDLTDLRTHLKERLPAYAIPAHIVVLAALPIQPTTGKVDRKRLPPITTASEPAAAPSGTFPTGIEPRMRDVWAGVLGQPPRSAGDNFFDLGGHSLLAIRLALETETAFGVRLDVVDVFNYPTLGAYCRHVAARTETSTTSPARAPSQIHARKDGPADIAVVGLACRFPGAETPEILWDKLVRGVECVRTFTAEELAARGVAPDLVADPAYVRAGAIVDDVAMFDSRFFGLSEREATLMDPQQRLFIECCHEALERAGHAADATELITGVWAGCYLPSYLVHHLGARDHLDPADPTTFHLAETGNDKDYLATRTAFLLGLEGPAISVQTSCSTGLVAIAEAAAALQAGRCGMALAGASSITFPQGGYLHVDGHIGSKSGHCRSFDKDADGTILGDGVGVVVLRRLEDALADGDEVLAVIKGFAVNNDGATKAGYSAPSGQGQARVIAAALDMAECDAASIGYVEAHGTATIVGDPIEVRALSEAYRNHTAECGYCVLGSVKANIGHSNIAAGAAGFIKAVLTLKHKRYAPQINFTAANPELRLSETPFRIVTAAHDWPASRAPRRAAVSSFGIGGTNAHMVLEEAPAPAAVASQQNSEILLLSAKTEAALASMSKRLADHFSGASAADLDAAAATLQIGRRHHARRRAIVAASPAEAAANLAELSHATGPRAGDGAVLLFSGQGSQHAGMGSGLMAVPRYAREFARTADLFRAQGIEIGPLHDPAMASAVLSTAPGLQASLFATEWALAETLMGFGVTPRALAGHSLGQIVAAAVSGMLRLEDAVRLVAVRAAAMQGAPAGAMLAMTTQPDAARALIARHPGVVVAAINAARNVVVAGTEADIARVEAAAAKARVAAQRLAVERAFHSPMMREAADRVAEAAAAMTMSPPRIPVACNVSGGWIGDGAIRDPGSYWSRHILAPVDFAANAQALLALSPAVVIEAGPGRALSRLVIDAARAKSSAAEVIPAMRHPRDCAVSDAEALDRCIARTWVSGIDIDWTAYREGRPARRVVLPTYAFERRRYWPKNDVALTPHERSRLSERKLPWQERFYVPAMRRASPPVHDQGPSSRQSWLLLGTRGGTGALGAALSKRLSEQGHDCETIDRDDGTMLAHAIDRLTTSAGEPRMLCIWPCFATGDGCALQVLNEAMLELARALIERKQQRPLHLHVLTRRALSAPGDEPSRPDCATILGPLLSLAQEEPSITTRLLDISAGTPVGATAEDWDAAAAEIVAEITAPNPRPEPQIALRGRVRWAERFDSLRLGEAQRLAGRQRLRAGPHIITGGLGRIGLALARHLCGLGAEVVLVTRRRMPPRTQWAALADAMDTEAALKSQLRALLAADDGTGRIAVATADVSAPRTMLALLRDCIDGHGRIGGIFHAAGLARLQDLADATPETLAAELAPKVAGTDELRAALGELGDAKPAFVMLFSSLAATLGGLGLGAYAAANRYLDAVVDAAPVRDGVPWISVGWDDWDFDYGEAQQAAYARTRAGLSITPEDGFAAIEAVLGEPELHRVLVSVTPLEPRIARWVARPLPQERVPEAASVAPISVTSATASRPASPAEARVYAAYAKVLGSTSAGLDDNFFDLGGDSLLATQVVLELARHAASGPRLRVTDVFDFPTIRTLAAHLTAEPPTTLRQRAPETAQ